MIMLDGVRADTINFVPYLQELKKEALFFSSLITYAPYTLASLHAIFSGMYGNTNGVNGYYKSYSFDKEHCFTLAQYLKENGYYTEADVINEDLIPKQGFDKVRIHDEFKSNLLERHPEILLQIKNKQPFFLFLDYNFVHTNLVKNIIKKYSDFSIEYFKNKEKNYSNYLVLVSEAGDYLKLMMDKLKELNLYGNSVVIIFADHGCSVGDRIGEKVYGVYLYDYTIRTFMYIIGKYLPKGVERKNVVRTADIMPTILDITKIHTKGGYKPIHGESLLNLKEDASNDVIAYSETGGLGGPTPSPEIHNVKAIRTNRWKLIYNTTNSKKELYDLENDKDEATNLSGKGYEIEDRLWDEMLRLDEKFKTETSRNFLQSQTRSFEQKEAMASEIPIRNGGNFEELHKKLREHLDMQSKEWKTFIYAQDKGFYQGFDEIKIEGCRPTEKRFKMYKIENYMSKDRLVLDIGSNCGFVSLFASRYFGHIDGVEINPYLVAIANDAKNYLKIKNAAFHCSSFEKFKIDKKFDVIFSFANDSTIDENTKFNFKEYIQKILFLLKSHGLLIFESQAEDMMEKNMFSPKLEILEKYFNVLEKRKVKSDYPYNVPERWFLVLKKR